MKRKGKQKKGTQSSTQQVRSKHEENCELEVALSSVESQIRTSTVSSSVARASTNPTCTTSVGTTVKEIIAPVTIKGDGHDRKHKRELLRADSQCSDSRDADTHLASEHDYADDDVAPELVAMHDLSLPSTSPGSTETRHLADKADSNALNSHRRRLSKREMKAMLKQNKRNRSALDEKLVATMDELAVHLKGDCIIDPNPSPLKPIRVAAPPNTTSTIQIMSTPIRRGVGGRRAGRRGGRRGRGGAKLVDIPRPDPLSNLPASWVPLMLPYTPPELDSRPSKPAFLPWLHLLPDARAHRFATNIRHVLSQHYSAAQPSVRAIVDNVPCKDNKHQTFMESVTPPSYLSLASTLSVRPTPMNDAHSLKTPVLSVDRQPKSNPPFAPQPFTELEKQDFQETSSLPPPQQMELRDVVQSATITTPARRPRGRCRGRRGSRLIGYASVRPTAVIGEVQTTVAYSGALINPELRAAAPAVTPKIPPKSVSKPRVSRELRGLVTWDAVIAQQKRQQEQAETVQEHPENAGTKVQHPNDLTTAVAQDLLAQAALEQNNLSTSRTRRTRQSSGSVLSQAAQSTHHSETASVVTTTAASELTVSELRFRTKRSDFSSIARSESSSIVSDVVTTPPRLSGLDQLADETKANRSLSRLRSSPVSQRAEKPGPPTKETAADSVIETHTPTSQTLSSSNDPTPYVAKYSPISVDHEPEPNLDLPSPNVLSSSTVVESSKRGRSKSRRNNKTHVLHAEFKGVAADLRSYSAHKQSTERFPASSPSPHTSSLPSKRRRQNATPTLPHGHIPPEFASSRGTGSVASAMSEESVPVPAATSGSGSLRRYASSRTSALPPRKRYKAGIDSPVVANDEDSTTAALATDASQNEVDVVAASDTLSIPTPPATHIDIVVGSSKGELSAHLTPATASIPRGYKRGRGRPSRRAGITAGSRLPGLVLVTATSTASPPAISPTDTQLSAGTTERPKREAAAIGFASLVAANLNNNSTTITPLDSPASRSQGNETPTARVADVSVDGVPPVTLPPPTPRGRGRPPKPKPTPQPPASVALTTDTDVSKPSELPSSVGRRKRPAAVLSPSGRNIKQPHLASTLPTTPNAVPKELDERTSPSSTLRRHMEQPSVSILSSADSEPFGLPAASPEVVPQPITPRKVGRPRSNKAPETPVRKLINPVPVPQTSPDSSTIQLPSRISLFKGHLLTDPISLGMNSVASTKGPVCDIFLRFLNEPDPLEPDSRLCAPFIFLPTPERYPEFYRFVISSYSGTLIRTRFVKSFLSRLFSVEPSNGTVLDEPIFGVEFPSLCLASIARRFVIEAEDSEQLEKLAQDLGLTESELGLISLNPADVENSIPLLDAAVESVLTVWESFAGRRSWLGRRLIRLRTLYSTLRNDCARSFAEEYGQFIPPLKATAVLNMPVCKTPGAGVKKKADRRALERGAEVIRCLCGFRVEGGHAMVQCDRCASWQHLPCLWWALNQAINNRRINRTVGRSGLCQAALVAAQAAGSGYLAELIEPKLSTKSDDTDLPYICPVCLELPDLTLEYPRSLSAAMAMNDLDSVFSLQETTVEGEHEFWSLASVDGRHQIRTDDYAFVNRAWMECVRTSQGILNRADMKSRHLTIDEARAAADAHPITTFYDRVVIRIYRLWKDKSGKPWLEGGLFLRPYDLLVTPEETNETAATQQRLWHYREVVYDEASRLVLPLSAWSGRCVVLCTSAYRTGRPADLLSSHEADQFLSGYTMVCNPNEPQNNTLEAIKRQAWRNQLFFVCDKLFERATPSSQTTTVRFDEISPGYLKVNMRPYCFLRKPDVTVGRATLPRHFTAAQLLEYDRVPVSEAGAPEPPIPTSVSFPISSKPKGEKLARVVDWLERKRLLDIKTVSNNQQPSEPAAAPVLSVPTTPHRGRPRGSRGRGRPPRSASQPVTDLGSEISSQVPTAVVHSDSAAAAVHMQPDGVLETADAVTITEAAVAEQSADSSESRAKKPLRPAEPLQPVTQELPTVSVSATEVPQERLELSAPLSESVVAPELLGREEPKIEPLPEVVPLEPIPSIVKQESDDVISSAASPHATGAVNDNVVVSEESLKVDNPSTSSDSNTTDVVNPHATEKRRYTVVTTTTDSMSTTSASARKRKCAVTRKRIASASASVISQVRETTTFFSDSEVLTEPTLEASTVVYSRNLAEDPFPMPDSTLIESTEAIASSESEPQPIPHETDRLTDVSFKTAVVCNSPLTAHTPSPKSLYEVEVWEGPQLSPTFTATELQENNPLNIPTETLTLTEYRIEVPTSQKQVVGELSFEAGQEASTDGDVCAHTATSSSVSSPERSTVDVNPEADFSAVRSDQVMETSQNKPDGPQATVAQTTEVETLMSTSPLEEPSASIPQMSLASCERVQSPNSPASLKIGDPTDSQTSCVKEQLDADTTRKGCTNFSVDCLASDETNPCIRLEERESSSSQPDETPETKCSPSPQPGSNQLSRESASPDPKTPCVTTASSVPDADIHSTAENGTTPYLESVVSDSGNDSGATPILDEPAMCGDSSHQPTSSQDIDSFSPTRMMDPLVKGKLPWCEHPTSPVLPERSESTRLQYNHQGSDPQQQHSRSDPPSHRGDRSRNQKAENTSRHSSLASERYSTNHHRSSDPRSTHNRNDRYGSAQSSHPCSGHSSSNSRSNYHGSHRHDRDRDDYHYPFHGHRDRSRSDSDQFHHRYYHKDHPNPNRYESNHGRRSHESRHPKFPRRHDST